jgi:hypothetical protein
MSAVPMTETARAAVGRLFADDLAKGYRIAGCHRYNAADGTELFRVVRLKHAERDKVIRPMYRDGFRYRMGRGTRPETGWPLYVPPFPLVEAGPVYVVEGEACADALARLGITATTSGSSSSADAADWTPLQGRSVRVWPDHDTAGAKYAADVAERLRAIGCVVECLDVAVLGLPDKGDCVDWLALHPDATADDVRALPVSKVVESRSGFAPEPLRRPLPLAEPYPLDALGDVLGGAARAILAVVQAPAGLCGQSVLSAASLAAQAHADVVIDGRREPLSLWHVTVGDSGERKSGADRWALQAHREVERTDADAYRQAMANHEVTLASHKAAGRAAERGKDAESIRANLEKLGAAPEPPLAPWLLLPEATLEGLHKLYQTGRGSLGLFNDDAGDFLDGHAMNRDNRTKSAAGFSKLWDSGEFSRIRAGDGAAKFYGRRLAMHVMVQPVIAERVLSDDVLCGQGFLPRCLVAWPASTVGTRTYQAADLSRDPALARYWSRMRDLLTEPLTLREGSRNELEPRALTLAPDAKALWVDVANAIEADMAGDFASVRAWASKAASQVARIAGVLTLVEEPGAGVIRRDAVERAARLAMYHLREAARVVGTASVPAKVRHAEALLSWCRETGRTLLYSSDALRTGPNCIRSIEAFRAAVEVLDLTGWIAYQQGGAELDGRKRAHVWQVRIGDAG